MKTEEDEESREEYEDEDHEEDETNPKKEEDDDDYEGNKFDDEEDYEEIGDLENIDHGLGTGSRDVFPLPLLTFFYFEMWLFIPTLNEAFLKNRVKKPFKEMLEFKKEYFG